MKIIIDADACPVKEEVYRVAARYELAVTVVANSPMRTPDREWIEMVVVSGRADAADDWIAERASAGDIVVTSDIPLAARCLAKGARVIDTKGNEFTENTIGDALATRELMSQLRDLEAATSRAPPFSPKDRSSFLQRLDRTIQSLRRGK